MEQFTKLPRWGQFVVVLMICVLLAVAAWYGFISGQKSALEQRMKLTVDLQGQIKQGQEAQRRVDELNRQIDAIRHDLDVLKSIIPMDPETGKLLRVFQSYARDQNLTITRISPSAITRRELYSEQSYGMDVAGGYHDIALFFDKLAHMRRIVNISDLTMKASTKKDVTVQSKFNAVVYMQNPDAFTALEGKKP